MSNKDRRRMDPEERRQENKRIYELRQEGLSRAALAERFGCTKDQITRILMTYRRKLRREQEKKR